MKIFAILFITLFLTSCAMPGDDCLCTTPNTNNPNVIPQRSGSNMPGMGM